MPTSPIIVTRVPNYFPAEGEFVLFVVDPSNNYGVYFIRLKYTLFHITDLPFRPVLPHRVELGFLTERTGQIVTAFPLLDHIK